MLTVCICAYMRVNDAEQHLGGSGTPTCLIMQIYVYDSVIKSFHLSGGTDSETSHTSKDGVSTPPPTVLSTSRNMINISPILYAAVTTAHRFYRPFVRRLASWLRHSPSISRQYVLVISLPRRYFVPRQGAAVVLHSGRGVRFPRDGIRVRFILSFRWNVKSGPRRVERRTRSWVFRSRSEFD